MKTTFRNSMLILLCAVVALSAMLVGCDQKEKNFPVAVSDTKRSALDLNNDARKDSDLEKIYDLMADGASVNQLNDKYEIKCLRKDGDTYRVIYWGNKRVLVLRFDQDGKWIKADKLRSYYTLSDSRGKYDSLKAGDTVEKVQTIDPTCYFAFLVDKTSDELYSDHYTEDGYYTHIEYDKDFNIVSISSQIM